MKGKMDWHGLTDIGKKRKNNEDQFLIADLSKSMRVHQTSLGLDDQTRLFGSSQGTLLLVADGMGGHAAGERASHLAVDSLTRYLLNTMHWFLRLDQKGEDDFLDNLKSALEHCQEEILAEAAEAPERHGMGTTLTVAYLIWPQLYIVHAGDSRCYLARGSELKQITHDHTMAQQFVEQGTLRAEDAESSRWSHVLWKVVGGTDDKVNPEVHKIHLELGDRLLLCTDGLHKHVSDEQIRQVIVRPIPAAETCQQLVDAANEEGGSDNITVVVAHFCGRESQETLLAQVAEEKEFEAEPDAAREAEASEAGSAVLEQAVERAV
jgi:serine/threonine protein phosphatase PrpC